MLGLPVLHHLLEFTQVHVHCSGDAIHPSDPLMPSSPSALNLSQHQELLLGQLFASDDQNTRVSASASVLPTSIQGWFPLRSTGWMSLLSKGLSGVFSSTTVGRHQFFWHSTFFTVQLSQPYVTNGKTRALTIQTSVGSDVSAFQHTV